MVIFLALAPSLLALLAHLGSANGSVNQETCLPNAIPEGSRRFLLDGGKELPLGVWALEWSSAWIAAWIFKILASEVLGFRTVIDSGATSFTAGYALAGCRAPASPMPQAQCEGAAFTEFHVSMEAWMTTLDERTMSALGARVGDRLPQVLGSIGYDGHMFFSVPGETFRRAWNGHGVSLDYHRSYNRTWHEPSAFFLPGENISTGELRPCEETRMAMPVVLQGYLAATGDEGGVIRRPDGQLAPRCFGGVWWRSPACRDSPERCVPLIAAADGWDVQFLMSSTSHLGMPVQLAAAAPGLWQTLPLRGRGTLFYWWFPDDTFATLDARQVILPPYDQDEWERGVQVTSGFAVPLGKLAAASLEAVAPKAFRLLDAFLLSAPKITQILEEHASLGRTHRQSACAWLRANEAVWRPWIPLDSACSAGEGVVDLAGQFVENVSLAVSCKRCTPGHVSERIGRGAARTYLCHTCPMGSFSNYFGATECEQCPPGTRSTLARGNDACARCPLGTFQPAYGSSACLDCAAWLLGAETPFEGAMHASDCRCPEGTHRVKGVRGGPHSCAACGEGSGLLCPAGLGPPQQAAGFFARKARMVEEQDAGLLRLSNGAAGGQVLAREPKMMRCETQAKCPAGLVLGHCPPHHELLACEGCEAGYVWQGTSCEACSPGDWVRLAAAAAIAALAGVAAACFGATKLSVGHFDLRTFLTSLGLGINCLQSVSSTSTLNVEWVEPMASLKRVLQLLNLDIGFLRIGCFFRTSSIVLEYAAGLTVPLYFAGVILASFGIRHFTGRCVQQPHVFNALGSMLMLFFLSMAMAAFVPFQCTANPDGTSSVSSVRSVLCWRGEEHATLLGLAAMATLLYVALPLAVVAFVTARYPRKMAQPGWQEFSTRWSFAFARFTKRCYFFGIIYMLRNFAMAVIPMTSADSTQVQILLLVGTTALYASFQILMQPWFTRIANVLDTATSLLLITILQGSAMLLPSLDDSEVSVLQVVFMLVTVGICLICASPLIWIAFEKLAGGGKYAFFLSHVKEEAAVRARYWKLVASTISPRSKVFLDSDNFQDMDTLFSTVAARTGHLVVIITPGILTRPWCAGEIAVAHQHRVPLVPVVFGPPWPPSSESIESDLKALGHGGMELLAGKGISPVHIRDAYQALAAAPPVLVEAHSEDGYDQAISAMLGIISGARLGDGTEAGEGGWGKRMTSPTPGGEGGKAAVLLRKLTSQKSFGAGGSVAQQDSLISRKLSRPEVNVGLLACSQDPEAVAARGVLCRMLRAKSVGGIAAFTSEDADDLSDFKSMVVLLSRGALRNADFALLVVLAFDAGIPVVPVKVHKDFEFPGASFYQQMDAGLVFGPNADIALAGMGSVRLAYERLFKIITVTLSTSAPMPVLEAEVEDLCGRLRALRAARQKSSNELSRNAKAAEPPPLSLCDNNKTTIMQLVI